MVSSPAFDAFRRRSELFWLITIVVIGAMVRFSSVFGTRFPAGDGGLFATMIEDIRRAGFALPAFTTYNGGDIPFAYPPLAFYVAAALPVDPLVTLQWIPPVLATACIIPIYLAGKQMTSTLGGLAAAGFYAVAPFGWFWLVQGGGLTRSLAMLLALLALVAGLRNRAALAGLLGGLTALTHPETGIFAAVVVVAMFATALSWRSIAVAGGVAVVVVLPWLAILVSQHGTDPLFAASSARAVNGLAALLSVSGGRPGMTDLAAAIGLIGLVASRVIWIYIATAAVALVLSTSVPTHLGPLAALGVGVTVVTYQLPRAVTATTAVLLVLGAGITIGNPQPLGSDDRVAMRWAQDETEADAHFVVLSDEHWSRSDEAEWFPHLSGRRSLTTMQGREWLPNWRSIAHNVEQLMLCPTSACVEAWLDHNDADYVYLADDCCERIVTLLDREPIFRHGSVTVLDARGSDAN